MNIFVLSPIPQEAARFHCDAHVVKMIVEYAQLLSTAHRLLDGNQELIKWTCPISGKNKARKIFVLSREEVRLVPQKDGKLKPAYFIDDRQSPVMAATHANHPSAVWARASDCNYHWLVQLLGALCAEYSVRYNKIHSVEKRCLPFLQQVPKNIVRSLQTPWPQAMPEGYKNEDAIEAYRDFYAGDKSRFAKWTTSPVPKWFIHRMEGKDSTIFSRSSN